MNQEAPNFLGRKLSRRELLHGAAVGGSALVIAATLGCEYVKTEEITTKQWEVDLSGKPLIPEGFAQKEAVEIIQDEIFPRVGILKTRTDIISGMPITQVQFKSTDGSFTIIGEGSYQWHRTEFARIIVDFLQTGPNSHYKFGLRGNYPSTVVSSGEKATKAEAESLRKEMAVILIRNFNQAIESGEKANVVYTNSQEVSTTSAPSQNK